MAQRVGEVRLFTESDLEKSLVGWRSASVGCGGLVNSKLGAAMIRVIVRKLVNGDLKDLYDQPILFENPGAIVVCQFGNTASLVQNYRFVGERILEAGVDYIRRLQEEKRWEELLATLGAWKWELPRGLLRNSNETDLNKFILETAKIETIEESGLTIADARICGRVNTNSTFFAHSQYVVYGRVVGRGRNRPEDGEILGRTKFFSAQEIRDMVNRAELDDGSTLAALAVAGFHF